MLTYTKKYRFMSAEQVLLFWFGVSVLIMQFGSKSGFSSFCCILFHADISFDLPFEFDSVQSKLHALDTPLQIVAMSLFPSIVSHSRIHSHSSYPQRGLFCTCRFCIRRNQSTWRKHRQAQRAHENSPCASIFCFYTQFLFL